MDAKIIAYKDYVYEKSKAETVTLLASELGANKTTTVSVAGVTENNIVIVSPDPSSLKAYGDAGCYCSAQSVGQLTFSADKTPSADLTVNVVIMN